jgi:hypothetical protein
MGWFRERARPPSMQAVVARPSSRQPLVVAVEAVSFHNLDHVTKFGLLHRARDWSVHFQGAVAAPAMIVLEVVAEKASQVAFTEDDHVIEALTPNAADDSLHEGTLPRAPRRGENLLDAEAFHTRLELVPVDAIAISDEEPRGRLPRERFGELLGGPLRGRLFGHVEVHDPTAGASENDEDEEDLEGDRGHDEEVDRHEVLHVVFEEGAPRRGGRLPGPHHVLLYRGLAHGDAELRKFAHNPWGAPAWVRRRHLSDEVPDLLGHRGSHRGPAISWAGEARPVVSEPATLPGDHGAGPDKDECAAPSTPGPREASPEEAIGDLDARSRAEALVDSELVTQSDDLELEGGSRPKTSAERGGEGEEDGSHAGARARYPLWRWLR